MGERRRRFAWEFKVEAVRLAQESGKPQTQWVVVGEQGRWALWGWAGRDCGPCYDFDVRFRVPFRPPQSVVGHDTLVPAWETIARVVPGAKDAMSSSAGRAGGDDPVGGGAARRPLDRGAAGDPERPPRRRRSEAEISGMAVRCGRPSYRSREPVMADHVRPRRGGAIVKTSIAGLLLLAGMLAPLPAPAGTLVLEKQAPELVEVVEEGARYRRDTRLGPEQAREVYRFFVRTKPGLERPFPALYAVPGASGLYLVTAAETVDRDRDYGMRVFLIRRTRTGFELLDRTRGESDSYILKPTFFTGGGRVLVLAEIGTEYAWGLAAYEVAGSRLRDLGTIDVSKEGEFDAVSPIPETTVKLRDRTWVVEFHTDLVFDPGGLNEREIKRRSGRPIVFELDGERFVQRETRAASERGRPAK